LECIFITHLLENRERVKKSFVSRGRFPIYTGIIPMRGGNSMRLGWIGFGRRVHTMVKEITCLDIGTHTFQTVSMADLAEGGVM
jgi:hypothetical protein